MDTVTILFTLAIVIALLALRFIWKNVRRGVTYVLLAILALWLFRAYIPVDWENFSDAVQVSAVKSFLQDFGR